MPKAPVSSRLSQMGFMKRAAKRKAEEAVAVAEEVICGTFICNSGWYSYS